MRKSAFFFALILGTALYGGELWRFAPDTVKAENKNSVITPVEDGFRLGKNSRFITAAAYPVDSSSEYIVSLQARKVAGETGAPKIWVLMEALNADGRVISQSSLKIADEQIFKLDKPIRHGAKVLYIPGAEKLAGQASRLCVAFNARADKRDLPNTTLSPIVSSIAADGTVTLKSIIRRAYPAGTEVRFHYSSAPHETLLRIAPSEKWRYFDARRKGVADSVAKGKFNAGTAKIRFKILTDGEIEIRNLRLVERKAPAEKKSPDFGKNAKVELIKQLKDGKISTVYLSWWGEPDGDVTKRLQAALDSRAKTVIIDKMSAPWITEPVFVRANTEIIFAEGAELVAKKNSFHGKNDSVLNLISASGVIVRGLGKGGIIRMHKSDYQDDSRYEKAEWRNCISIRGGKNIRIENMRLADSGGDGIIVSHEGKDFPENIVIRKVDCDNNHRQGLSIICGRNILVENSLFRNTSGTNPQAGIDIESNKNDDPISNIVIRNCEMRDNAGAGIIVSATRMDTNIAGKLSVTVENCRMIDNKAGDLHMGTRSRWIRNEDCEGVVHFKDCVFENNKHDNHRRYSIDMEYDVRHNLTVILENLVLKRGPVKNRAVRIAHCQPGDRFSVPRSKVIFKGFRSDVPADELLQFADHSFSGRADIVQGIPFAPGKYPQIQEQKIEPLSTSAYFVYPAVYQVLKADFWVEAQAEKPAIFELEYAYLGRRSRTTTVSLISPDGTEKELGKMTAKQCKKFTFTPEKSGFYRIKVRGGINPKIALKSSNVPAGIYADPADTVLYDPAEIYFRIPENSREFAVRIWGRSNILGVKAEIFDPAGKLVFEQDIVGEGAQHTPGPAERSRAGVWKIKLSKGSKYFAKYHIALPGVSPYLGVTPAGVPEVKYADQQLAR